MPVKQQAAKSTTPKGSAASNDDIIGFKKEVFMDLLKWGAIAGGIAGLISFFGGLLTSAFSWFGLGFFGAATWGIYSFYAFFSDILLGIVYGIITIFLVVKFYDKFPFKTLFMKLFGLMLIIDLVVSLLFGGFLLLFAGPLSFLIWIVTIVVADFVFAKIAANKVGPMMGLQ